jgi:hypothetical protein
MSNVEPHFIEHSIRSIRGHRVMLDRDLAKLYGVETRVWRDAGLDVTNCDIQSCGKNGPEKEALTHLQNMELP